MNRAVIELNDMSDKLCTQIDNDYKEIINFKDSWEEIQKKVKEKKRYYDKEWDGIYNFWIQYVRRDGIDYGEVRGKILLHEHKWTDLSLQIYHIKNKKCHHCKHNFSLDNVHVYSHKQGELKTWAINKVEQFDGLSDWEIRENTPLFCSDNCFQKSSLSKRKPNKPQSSQPEIPPRQPQETNAWWCANCYQDKTGSYLYNTKTNDDKKFCSEECYDQAYGETCCVCYKKFLNFRRDDNNLVYCSPCWKTYWDQKVSELEKELQQDREGSEELKKQLAEIDKKIKTNTEIINSVGKEDGDENKSRERERERENKFNNLLVN